MNVTGPSTLSVVIPVLNEEENIPVLHQRLSALGLDIGEIIFVDDGSTDRSMEMIQELALKDKRVRAISFSRNFGHQPALLAGLMLAKQPLVVVMDGDLQHPPEIIPEMLRMYREGFDLVSAQRTSTADAGLLKRLSSRAFYAFLNFISDTDIKEGVADFRLMNRKVVDSILQFQENELFLRGIFSWIGFRQATIPFDAPKRSHGRSKYSYSRMMSLGLKGALSFSFKPLRISLFIGTIVSSAAFCFAGYSINAYINGKTVPGWTSIITAVMLMGGVQLMVLGLIGEYVASLFREVKKRPMFIVDRKVNID